MCPRARMALGHIQPTGYATCMTFRHRHRRQCRLIEAAKVEQGKVEAGERKGSCEEDERATRREGGPLSRFVLVSLPLCPAWRQRSSRTCTSTRQAPEKVCRGGKDQAP